MIGGHESIERGFPKVATRPVSRLRLDFWLVAGVSLLFGGVAGAWYSPAAVGHHMGLHALQLAGGSIAMALVVAVLGTFLSGRNAVRWGIGMPLFVYLLGTLVALSFGREGALGLLIGAPLLSGLAIAGGLLTTYLLDGAGRVREV